ncbi:MAG: PAC2 family protein, partial [Candidatus Micrarchaeota archaeon]|nr:PAC2 family protein [Candidatus Micrarchaeota archaeon]
EEGEKEVFGIASTPEMQKLIKSHNVRMIKEGATTGVSGVLLAECASVGFPAVSLLSQARPELMDPLAAAVVLDKLKEILKLDLDTCELISESKAIEGKIQQMMQNAKTAHTHYQVVQSLGPMYG